MKRWWNSITTTIWVTVLVAMGLGYSLQQDVTIGLQALGAGPHADSQKEMLETFGQLPGELARLVEVLDAVPNDQRPTIIQVSHLSHVQLELRDTPYPKLVTKADEPNAVILRRRIEAALTSPRLVIAANRNAVVDQPPSGDAAGPISGILVEAALADGHWLLAVTNLDAPFNPDPAMVAFSRESIAAWLALSAILAIAVSALAARRLGKPLSELTKAAENVGGTGDAPPLVPRGPEEVQAAVHAFNRMQERLRRFNEDRTSMLSAISHDLRTPITRLKLRVETIEKGEHQEKMLAELETMMKMIESILAFARGDIEREPRVLVDLSALVDEICQDAADAGDQVTFSGPRGVTISCRPTVLRRAISNLVENAVKYGELATVTLSLEPEHVVISIEDQGPGIPRSQRERVFEPFYRLDGARNPDAGGVGLGLSVARSIVWEHGGDITLANRKGGGLCVRVELPAALGSNGPTSRTEREPTGLPKQEKVDSGT